MAKEAIAIEWCEEAIAIEWCEDDLVFSVEEDVEIEDGCFHFYDMWGDL